MEIYDKMSESGGIERLTTRWRSIYDADVLRSLHCHAVAAAFLEPERYRDMVIPVYAELLTPNQLVETFTRVTGIKARCEPCEQCRLMTQML